MNNLYLFFKKIAECIKFLYNNLFRCFHLFDSCSSRMHMRLPNMNFFYQCTKGTAVSILVIICISELSLQM